MDSATVEIVVQQDSEITIQPVDDPLCSGSSPVTLEVNQPGGIWAGMGITDQVAGIFDPGLVPADQTYTISYAFAEGACDNRGSIDIRVVSSETAMVQDRMICTDSETTTIVGRCCWRRVERNRS